jgi:hypothetical protein
VGKLIVGPGVAMGSVAIYNTVKPIVKPLGFDVTIISWNRPGATVAGTDRPSRHSTGEALDLRPAGAQLIANGSPCGGDILDDKSMRKGDQLAAALEAAGLAVVLWRTCEGGNHYDHVHTDNGGVAMKGIPATVNAAEFKTGLVPDFIPGSGAINGVNDAIRFLADDRGLIRIAEVVLGFAALTLGAVGLILEGIRNNEVATNLSGLSPDEARLYAAGRAAGEPRSARGIASSIANPQAASREKANQRSERRLQTRYGSTSGSMAKPPKRAAKEGDIPGSSRPKRSSQSEATRIRKATTAEKRKAMQGVF